ncbi:hypothetical protein TELCIR_11272 [Teladorsagia circumcincta]|uniref:BTB domain-containing protein n=1 Tax=Teladorsagia circumcincta TaxID=45464 RepID=A0A2G9U9S1_TELCI|nr:hypothetical protein TELCIR_11272 [Teladorsagia circumcincta]
MWLRYVYTGRVEWGTEDTENILKLAEQYGPDDLPSLCIRLRAPSKADEVVSSGAPPSECSLETTSEANIAPSDTRVPDRPKSTSQASSNQPSVPKAEVVIPEELKIKLSETLTANDTADITIDYEDPLQGISLDQTSAEQSLEDDCVIVDSTPNKSENYGSGDSDNDIVCLGEQPATQASTVSKDPYRNEYFDYHDPFMEPWYDPVEMNEPSPSQPVSKPVRDDAEILTDILDKAGRRRSSRILRQSPTSGITPMPNYDGMSDDELKRELAKFGLKPMGRKRAVAMLKQIYTEVHPDDFIDLGDKTLNDPRDEPIEESMIDDTGILPKVVSLNDGSR